MKSKYQMTSMGHLMNRVDAISTQLSTYSKILGPPICRRKMNFKSSKPEDIFGLV